ncbi:UDP-glucose dehydrogenase family protein [Ilumatobacter coccineus]|uniref:UDP-glucose 6-dehydrogenase n=1 Tax=Ilumatobacter coccineus (strain NBRC 103263 / KCTC 29153 / YM16-304) TaxID=1313172 RepID=A0A6C7EBD9_ILUCY|nr:UDP-glucose 6-dehydrogenase [Ilumatobacter coccineus YM16-304]
MPETEIRLGVVGTGYVGLTTGACFAHMGHRVVCGDIDQRKVDLLNDGHIPIVEDGLEQIVNDARGVGRLEFVLGSQAAATDADIVFLCVPTPQGDDGSADLSYIQQAAREIAPILKPGAVVVNKSTVPVGSTVAVERELQRDDVFVVSNPEFLREGTAVRDFLQPDRVVIGSADRGAAEKVAELYDSIDTPIIITDPASAETIKYAANGFLAMKISFVNAVAAMCEAVGADVAAVVDGIGSDTRIGGQFLKPGPGWGGSCFPKDSRALVKIAEEHGYNFSMMKGVIDVNTEQRGRMIDKVAKAVGRHHSNLSGVTVGAMGLTFKAGTDDLRESPAMAIIADLRRAGARVRAFDPTTCGELSPHQESTLDGIELTKELIDVADGADVICVFTEWPEFAKVDLDQVAARAGAGTTVVDMRNLFDPFAVKSAGLGYDGVGRN